MDLIQPWDGWVRRRGATGVERPGGGYHPRRANRRSIAARRLVEVNPFADVLAANETFAAGYEYAGLKGRARRGLAVLTCIDSRIDPLGMLGVVPGDAKILRNAGARVTDDVLRTLVLASYLLGVTRVMVVAHTDCRMTTDSEDDVHVAVASAGGPDTRSLSFLTTKDVEASVTSDVQRVRSSPYLQGLHVGGFIYRLDTGRLDQVAT
jgi:carbonic anhydrase